jgi:hypothetical protein
VALVAVLALVLLLMWRAGEFAMLRDLALAGPRWALLVLALVLAAIAWWFGWRGLR